MITAVEPRSHRTPALAISLALHGSMLLAVAALVPAWHFATHGDFFRNATQCVPPCGLVTVRVLQRAAAAIAAPLPDRALQVPKPMLSREGSAVEVSAPVVVPAGSATGARPIVRLLDSTTRIIALPAVQPTPIAMLSLDNVATRLRSTLAPGNWGSRFDTPTLRDRALYDEIVARLPKGGSITILVDEHGRATDVLINAPGLDAATVDDLRARLLGARYAPVERDGVAFDGKLKIESR